jgi:hypothetical protein
MGWFKPWKKYLLPKMVIIRGAVSPAIRATARSVPVSKPALAVGNTTLRVVRHLWAPRARDASLTLLGTSYRDSSVVRATIGIRMNDSAMAPAIAE